MRQHPPHHAPLRSIQMELHDSIVGDINTMVIIAITYGQTVFSPESFNREIGRVYNQSI